MAKLTEEEIAVKDRKYEAAEVLLGNVLSHYGIDKEKFLHCKDGEIIAVKHCLWFYLYNIRELTYCQIAVLSELKGHNPVLRGVRKIGDYLDYDICTRKTYAEIKEIAG